MDIEDTNERYFVTVEFSGRGVGSMAGALGGVISRWLIRMLSVHKMGIYSGIWHTLFFEISSCNT